MASHRNPVAEAGTESSSRRQHSIALATKPSFLCLQSSASFSTPLPIRACREYFTLKVVWHGVCQHMPSSAASKGTDTAGSSYLHPSCLPQDLSELQIFRQDLLKTWKLVSPTRAKEAVKGENLLAEPLLHNSHLSVQVVESTLVRLMLVLSESCGRVLSAFLSPWPSCPCHLTAVPRSSPAVPDVQSEPTGPPLNSTQETSVHAHAPYYSLPRPRVLP